jgi:glycosyltransferase involved in cell wall biosynthesis
MNDSPLVSIVIPTYNHAPMLQRALATVIEQTYQNWNAIVVNNFYEVLVFKIKKPSDLLFTTVFFSYSNTTTKTKSNQIIIAN